MNSMLVKLTFLFTSLIFVNDFSFFDTNDKGKDKYDKLWEKVEKYEEDALPKYALETVEEIYDIAVSENNDKQIIKATIFRMKYNNILEEEGY
ncbi:MAG: hypothetical protein C0596_12245 [Marinilabiliales bacterium]|nr:MAG: hypothetical protein C0596_12245 [Marinilabiliales bacterium]